MAPSLDAARGGNKSSELLPMCRKREQESPLLLRERDLQPGDLLLEWAQGKFNKAPVMSDKITARRVRDRGEEENQ